MATNHKQHKTLKESIEFKIQTHIHTHTYAHIQYINHTYNTTDPGISFYVAIHIFPDN